MYAVIISGGKQYRVHKGDVIQVEKLAAEDTAELIFDKVLMLRDGDRCEIGAPYLENRHVVGRAVAQTRGKKISGIKFKRRKNYLRRYGHRQHYTNVEITDIT